MHVLCDVKGCPAEILNNSDLLTYFACQAAEKAGATILNTVQHEFEPQGVTVLLLLAESHLSIHTWPESGMAAIDVYTCGQTTDPDEAIVHLIMALEATHFGLHKVARPMEGRPKPAKCWWRRLLRWLEW